MADITASPKPTSDFKGIPKAPDIASMLNHDTESRRDELQGGRYVQREIGHVSGKHVARELNRFLESLKETIEVLIGHRGNWDDRAITVSDLIDAGMVRYLNDQEVSVSRPAPGVYPTDAPNPPRDLEFLQRDGGNALTAMTHQLQWVNANNPDDSIVATQVWCSVGNNSRSNATLIGIVTLPNNWFINANPDPDEDHYYWIRHVNWAGMYSEWEPTAIQGGLVITKEDTIDNTVAAMLAALQGEDFESTYSAVTEYVVNDRVKYEGSDGVERNYVCVKDEPDMVTTGDFASDANWTKGTGWTIANGVASSDGSQVSTSDLEQEITFTNGTAYTVQFTMVGRTAGSVTPYVNGTAGTARTAAGTYIETITAGASGYLDLEASADFVGSIDNVRVALVTGGTGITGQDPETYWPRWWKRTGVISVGEIDGETTVGIDGDLVVAGTINTSRVKLSSEDGKTTLEGDALTVYDDSGQLRVKLGRLV